MPSRRRKEKSCSFCGKPVELTNATIFSELDDGVGICDHCVAGCIVKLMPPGFVQRAEEYMTGKRIEGRKPQWR